MIASNDRAVGRLHQIDTLGRVGAVSDDVSEAEEPLKSPGSGVINDRSQSFDVSVNVRNKREFPKVLLHKGAVPSISAMFVKSLMGIPT